MTSKTPRPVGPAPDRLDLPATAHVLIASDMHLGDHDRDTARWFTRALLAMLDQAAGGPAKQPRFSHLLLLGDLFEGWPGDDAADQVSQAFLDTLRAISRRVPVYVLHGNRDFLLDVPLADAAHAGFSAKTGASLLADPCTLSIGPLQLLIAHGDAYCTDDAAYMSFRAQSRTPQWQRQFLSAPVAQRRQTVQAMRADSRKHQANASPVIGDVNPQAVDDALNEAALTILIHGHTHRPQSHHWVFEGKSRARHVLSDWHAADARGDFLSLSAQGVARIAPPPPPT